MNLLGSNIFKSYFILGVGLLCLNGCQTGNVSQSKNSVVGKHIQSNTLENNEILATNMSFDLEKGEIHYTLPEKAFVRVRVGIRDGGAMLRTLVDWELREAGEHVEPLGFENKNSENIFSHRQDLMAVIACLRPTINNQLPQHSSTIGGLRKSPDFSIVFPDTDDRTKEDLFRIKDTVTLRVILNPEDVKWLTESKYEMGIYIDGIFLVEDEEGSNPYNYRLDTRMLNNGLHTITVNVISYTGEIGTKSIPVYIDNSH